MSIIELIQLLKKYYLISETDIEKVINNEIGLCDLSQIATKKYYSCLEEKKESRKEKEIEIIDLRSKKDIILEDEIGEPNFYKFNTETESLNLFSDLIDNYY